MPLSEILIYVVLGLQVAGLLLTSIVWRRQNSSHLAALDETREDLNKGRERLESLVRDEMADNRRESGEQARLSRDDLSASVAKLGEHFAVLQSENLIFREQLSANLDAFAGVLKQQIEAADGADKDESARLSAELFTMFDDFGNALVRQLAEAINAQDRRFEKFEQRLLAVGERSAEQIHSLDDAIVAQLDEQRAQNRTFNQELARELREELTRLTKAVGQNAHASEAPNAPLDSFLKRMDVMAQEGQSPILTKTTPAL